MTVSGTGPALKLAGISKQFNGNYALRDVGLEVGRGEIHALLGANGSGKSTLIKILSGYHHPESGWSAELDGQPFALGSAGEAHRSGVRVIHQDLGLVDDLSVLDNLALGQGYEHRYWVSDRRERMATRALLERYGVTVEPSRLVGSLSSAEKTMVAVTRALRDRPERGGVVVLDEPTASLPERERGRVFEMVRSIVFHSGAVIYVTHRLDEVFRLADRVTVLRDGRVAATRAVGDVTHDELIELIVGQPIDTVFPETEARGTDAVVLSVSGLSGSRIAGASLSVREGEVVGVIGLTGSGADELLPLIFGATTRSSGDVEVAGERVPMNSPAAALARGLVFAPADRARLSTIPSWTLAENMTLSRLDDVTRRTWLSLRAEREESVGWLRELDVRPCEPAAKMSTLSGGNQQKTVLAKWLRCRPRVVMLQEPTAGVDIGARRRIYEAMARATAGGAGVLISSTDVDEICGLCGRVLVMARGRLIAELTGDQVSPHHLTAGMLRERSAIPSTIGDHR